MATNNDNKDIVKAANTRLRAQIKALRQELDDTKQLLQAIQQGSVDAFVVDHKDKQQVFTLEGAERPFRTVIETMNEGAATLTEDGVILYCNGRFAEILELALNNILGRRISEFLTGENIKLFERMTKGCYHCRMRGELTLTAQSGKEVSVYAALSPLEEQEIPSICLVITDISDLKRKNKELLGDALRAGQVLAYEWHCGTDVVIRSENAADLFGKNALKSTRAEYFTIVHPDDLPILEKTINDLRPNGPNYRLQYRLVLAGKVKWVEDAAEGIFDQDGKLLRLHGLMLDITDRMQVEEMLRQNREDLSRAQAVGNIGSWRLNVRRNELTWSDENYRIFGYTVGMPQTYETFLSVVHPDDREYVDAKWKAALAGEAYDIEHRLVVEGKIKWVREKAYLELDEHNEVLGAFGITQDITERREAEDALRESEERLRLTAESANVGQWERDLGNDVLTGSDKFREIYCLPDQKQISYSDWLNCVHQEDSQHVDDDLKRAIREHVDYSDEYRIICSDNNFRWILSRGRTEYDESGKPVRMMGICMDVTEQRHHQQQLEELTRKLDNQAKELEAIIGVVSHDLRAPLVNVRGFSNFIKQDFEAVKKLLLDVYIPAQIDEQLKPILEKSVPEAIGFIDSSADAMNTLVKSLVDVARIGLAVIKPEMLDMNEIVRKIVSVLEIKFVKSGAKIYYDNLPPCWADRAQVTQIFTNVIDNAVKYLDPTRQGEICIGGEIIKDRVIYCVADNGIGIALDNQEKVFEIFTRLAEKSHAEGEGMGLTMVKRMVDRNNGKIWLQSELNKGSAFFISLPSQGDS